jgi:hypothetical protein
VAPNKQVVFTPASKWNPAKKRSRKSTTMKRRTTRRY